MNVISFTCNDIPSFKREIVDTGYGIDGIEAEGKSVSMLSLEAGSFNLKHFLVTQHCFFLPGAPNLGLSLQLLQLLDNHGIDYVFFVLTIIILLLNKIKNICTYISPLV